MLLWTAAVAWSAEVPLKLNTYYLCNGQRIVIRSCVDQSDKEQADTLAGAAENKYNSMVEQGQKLAEQAKSTFDGTMQNLQQGMGELQNTVKEGLQELQQKALDKKGAFDRGMQQANDAIQAARAELQQGLAAAAQQGQELAAKAVDAAKQGAEAVKQEIKEMAPEVSKEAMKQAGYLAVKHGVMAATGDGDTAEMAKTTAEKTVEWAEAGGAEMAKAKLNEVKSDIKDATTVSSPEKINEAAQQHDRVSRESPENKAWQDADLNKRVPSDVGEANRGAPEGPGKATSAPAAPENAKATAENENKVWQDPNLNQRTGTDIERSKFAGSQSNGTEPSKAATPEPGIDQSKFAKKGPEHSAFLSPELAEKYRQRQADLNQSSDSAQSPAPPKSPAAAPLEVPAPTPTQVAPPAPTQAPTAAPSMPSTPAPPSAPAPTPPPTVPPPSMKM